MELVDYGILNQEKILDFWRGMRTKYFHAILVITASILSLVRRTTAALYGKMMKKYDHYSVL
jgi:hypothetical protein